MLKQTFRFDFQAWGGNTAKDVSICLKYHYPAIWRSVYFSFSILHILLFSIARSKGHLASRSEETIVIHLVYFQI